MINSIKRSLAAVAAVLLMTVGAQAGTDGTAGATSTGTVPIQVDLANVVKISKVPASVDLGQWDTVGDVNLPFEVCVYHTSPTFNIELQSATSPSNQFSFQMRRAGGPADTTLLASDEVFPYVMTLVSDADSTDNLILSERTVHTGFLGDTSDTTCGGTTNVAFNLRIVSSQMANHVRDVYSDTLTFIVSVP